MVFEILNKIAQILNKKKWAKTEENVNNITKILKLTNKTVLFI